MNYVITHDPIKYHTSTISGIPETRVRRCLFGESPAYLIRVAAWGNTRILGKFQIIP